MGVTGRVPAALCKRRRSAFDPRHFHLRYRQETGEERNERGRFDPVRADAERPQQGQDDRGDEEQQAQGASSHDWVAALLNVK